MMQAVSSRGHESAPRPGPAPPSLSVRHSRVQALRLVAGAEGRAVLPPPSSPGPVGGRGGGEKGRGVEVVEVVAAATLPAAVGRVAFAVGQAQEVGQRQVALV